jgi:hypothetical protein
VTALPPSLVGALNATEIKAFPLVAIGWAGASGAIAATVAAAEAIDSLLSPSTLVAWTVQVYDLPRVRLVTPIGDEPPVPVPLTPPFDDAQLAV